MWEKISQYAINLSSHFISGTLISLVFCVRIQEYDQIYINIMQIEWIYKFDKPFSVTV